MSFSEWLRTAGQLIRAPFVWGVHSVKGMRALFTRPTALIAVLLICGLGIGLAAWKYLPQKAPFVHAPESINVKPMDMVHIQVQTNNAQGLDWDTNAADAKLASWPGTSSAVVQFPTESKYWVKARAALGSRIACGETQITVGQPAPPTPPTPPGPVDPLTQTLQTAYNADTDTDKASSLAFLRQAYASMASQAKGWTTVKTNADALAKMKSIIEAPGTGLPSTKIANLRKAIGADLTQKFGTTGTAPIDRSALAVELDKVASALRGVH